MAVMRVVSMVTTFNCARDNCFLNAANNKAPLAPTPAASVGVANPASIDPNTTIISNNGGTSAENKLCSGSSVADAVAGASILVAASSDLPDFMPTTMT